MLRTAFLGRQRIDKDSFGAHTRWSLRLHKLTRQICHHFRRNSPETRKKFSYRTRPWNLPIHQQISYLLNTVGHSDRCCGRQKSVKAKLGQKFGRCRKIHFESRYSFNSNSWDQGARYRRLLGFQCLPSLLVLIVNHAAPTSPLLSWMADPDLPCTVTNPATYAQICGRRDCAKNLAFPLKWLDRSSKGRPVYQ